MNKYKKLIQFIKEQYQNEDAIPLHRPLFDNLEKEYLIDCIDSTFVSSDGKYINQVESYLENYCQSKKVVACVNGTMGLFTALKSIGLGPGDEVITQSLTFVATANSIAYCNARPVFIDCNKETLGMSAHILKNFLQTSTIIKNKRCFNKNTGAEIKACVPVHIFGNPCEIDLIVELCHEYYIKVIEDAAEALGSFYKGQHLGTFGDLGVLSFNGNKLVTAGGGGAILCKEIEDGNRLKHLVTTAKKAHPYEYFHDELGFNFRMPNLNASLLMAQLTKLDVFLEKKKILSEGYAEFCANNEIDFYKTSLDSSVNHWLNAIFLKEENERDQFLTYAIENKVFCRPVWKLMHHLPMYQHCEKTDMTTAESLARAIVNLPSSVPL